MLLETAGDGLVGFEHQREKWRVGRQAAAFFRCLHAPKIGLVLGDAEAPLGKEQRLGLRRRVLQDAVDEDQMVPSS